MSEPDIDQIMARARTMADRGWLSDTLPLDEVLILVAEIDRLRAEVLRLCMERPADDRE